MRQGLFEIAENRIIAKNTVRMRLIGDISGITRPGQFINIKLEGFFLRRPISVCDAENGEMTIIFKTVGSGTKALARMTNGSVLDILTGLGNGYETSVSGPSPLLIGGGAGIPPMYMLAKKLIKENKDVSVILGFNTADEVFCEREFRELGADAAVATADGSYGKKGFVTDVIEPGYSHFYACGPEPMLKAVYRITDTSGQFSFEERMGCGFGACMGCSCKTVTGYKRICKDGPVLMKEEILWQA